ncbi:glycerophosphodiester phosphodiesterase [Bengtsoniella intestinalis]|uniref:glycerophosphodiester phosphodiesterase n=1 Tax=Bengtsoniella intestinalis TaxID=3073143 RepID=UPI00391EE4B4
MTLNFAHRGFSGRYPENTMLAFEKALDAGADGIELDVHLSKDGIPVIIHDETVNRTTNGTGRVCDLTAVELSALDANAGFQGQYAPCPVPTLEQYFKWVVNTALITNIELKTNILAYDGLEQLVWDLIVKYQLEERILVSSFNHYSVQRMKAIAPLLPCGLLTESWLVNAGDYVQALGMDTYHPIHGNVNEQLMEELAGVGVYTFTVNEPETVKRLAKLGVAGIIGNFPDMTGRVLAAL